MSTISSPQSIPKQPLALLQHGVVKLLQIALFGCALAYFFRPSDLSQSAWNLFSIFLCTIIAIITKPFPMGAISMLGLTMLSITKTLQLKTILQGFSYEPIWLVVLACFLARGIIKTGLGQRIAYRFIAFFGGTPYGMAYGLTFSSACIAPINW